MLMSVGVSIIEDYRHAAETILKNPGIGEKIALNPGYKILYNYKTIGMSYTESHVSRGSQYGSLFV